MTEPLDVIEMKQALVDVANLARTFYDALREQGFDQAQALTLTAEWLAATVGSRS